MPHRIHWEVHMKRVLCSSVAAIAIAAFLAVTPARVSAQNVAIDRDDIGGVVTGRTGRKPASG